MESSESEYIDSIVVGDNVKYGEEIEGMEAEYLVKETVPVAMDSLYNSVLLCKFAQYFGI